MKLVFPLATTGRLIHDSYLEVWEWKLIRHEQLIWQWIKMERHVYICGVTEMKRRDPKVRLG